MITIVRKHIYILFVLLSVHMLQAQIDSLIQQDSINEAIMNTFNEKISKIETQRLADSLKKVALEDEIAKLKTTDNLKKEELLKKLEEINSKEAARLTQKKQEIEKLRASAKSYPVLGPFKDTLFYIYARQGSFMPYDRAKAITKRINDVAGVLKFDESTIEIEVDDYVSLKAGDDIILSVSDEDAIWNNTSKEILGQQYKEVIDKAVISYKDQTSFTNLAKEIGLALLVIVVVVLIVKYASRMFRWLSVKIQKWEGDKLNGFKIKSYTLLDSHFQVQALLIVNNLVKWAFILLLMYIALPVLFGIFPWTQNFAETMFGYILRPVKSIFLGLWDYLPNLITVVVIIVVFRYVVKALRFFKTEIEEGKLEITGFYPDWASPTFQIIRILLYAFMFILVYQYLPLSDSDAFKGVSVFLGFLFTFASAGSLSNIIAGIVLTYMRSFKIGDRVKIGEITGDIIEKSLLVTRVRSTKNEIISIPNATVMNSHTVNYSSDAPEKGLIIHTTVTIGYDVPWKLMHETLIEAAKRTDLILKDPTPFVLQTSLEDFYVAYQINAYIREANKQAAIYSNLHQNIQDVCNENGIEILSPHYRAARDGNKTTIPEDYLPEDYKTPGFNVNMNKEKE
ncbi:mechanosensitive ion channel family protein [Neptunitalea lumnitzerae]|uniref:Ion channel n=1 Tax=Neptunitalea lumnitzerae TaxID=2965509 RepID=A0ABQ5MGX3_9FLAO|nr:mechanosensitive ion channel family protein [Neptunitalea sp. Y10]GLB48639.1 ion channel [Neptunitalea sp. Y10]